MDAPRPRGHLGALRSLTRRGLLLAVAAADFARAQGSKAPPSAWRNEEDFQVTLRRLIGDANAEAGRVQLTLPEIAESGNSIRMTVQVDSPMTAADHVRLIHVIGERNPRPWLASFTLGPRAGKAFVELNVRLADSQGVAAYAQMSDGSWWTQRTSVVVTIGACESLDTRH